MPWRDRGRERDACGTGFVADAEGRASRDVVVTAIEALRRVRHRGAVSADARTGDGAGLLLPIPRRLLFEEMQRDYSDVRPPDPERIGLGMLFVSGGVDLGTVRRIVSRCCHREEIRIAAWREVPTDPEALGRRARETIPRIVQAIVERPADVPVREADRSGFRARRRAEAAFGESGADVYVASLGFSTVVYKALVAADQLDRFYPDLQDDRFDGWFAVFHQRYSTNTTPTWERAQPFRMLCHNGEINTIEGNVRRMRAREGGLGAGSIEDEALLRPVIDERGSDSAMLDNALELLTREGPTLQGARDIRHAVAMLVPPAWEGDVDLDDEVVDLYRWHAAVMEPWDGPAALIFTDGARVGAVQDRNGLRPMRYAAFDDGLVVCASEAGVVDVTGRGPLTRGALAPGRMIAVDPADGGLDLDPVRPFSRRRPYGAWLDRGRIHPPADAPAVEIPDDLVRLQVMHGYTREDISLLLRPAATSGKEPTFSMGDDTPIAPFSAHRRPLYGYFKQRFAQVTNPAIDHVRERFVMSLRTLLGPRDPLLWERPDATPLLEYETFVLFDTPVGCTLDATWAVVEGRSGLRRALDDLAERAVCAAANGEGILVVTDERAGADRAPIPSLIAVGAVNEALVRAGLRTKTSLVVRTDDARESHHFACLLGYGAEAIVPRLALATVASLARSGAEEHGSVDTALLSYRTAVEEGVLKVLAKLGISCVDSYRGAQSFDVVGIGEEVIARCFEGTSSPIGGLGFDDIADDVLARNAAAHDDPPTVANPGFVKFRRGGEHHASNPDAVRALHRVVDPHLERLRSTAAAGERRPGGGAAGRDEDADLRRAAHILQRAVRSGDRALYARFAELVDGHPPTSPRDLLETVPAGPPIPVEEVEPVAEILRRFSTGAISHGAISREAHETLALAMNAIGGRSNSGEGGEDPDRFRSDRNSRIKQVASGRFGVTPEYCAFAEELQIKIAQGSKPGEGGQLPGNKVTEEIARLRHTQPGIALISPAPHHDIYSIEDIAQLTFDLKQVNPRADVSVKLVAESGVGTIAAGVVKGLAEVVHIAGSDGGTGASPLSSIKNAGLPWEIGLAETQQVLAEEGLRGRVRIRVDGGIRTGRDVVVAALLGADEYSFGSAALVAEGCIMVRTCHLDTCPVGIATQRPELRERFAGTPELVASYLTAVAEDVRRQLAALGLRTMSEAVGRADLLRRRMRGGRSDSIDLGGLLRPPEGERSFSGPIALQQQRSALGDRVFGDAWPIVRDGESGMLRYAITNRDRAVGARLGGRIGQEFGASRPPGSAHITFEGSAGQSFGAFISAGVEMCLVGEANDYVGKGMGGGRIVIVAPPNDRGDPVLVGNTALYGATGGELFVAGRAGERFAVRNSGAVAVVEGVGANGCEYMTAGTVVVLGPVGLNFAAGMTGGEAFVHDPIAGFPARVNPELVDARRPVAGELETVRRHVQRHMELTGSAKAAGILEGWAAARMHFWVVCPRDDVTQLARESEGTVRAGR